MTTKREFEPPTTPPLRFSPSGEKELAKSDREFRLYMEAIEMLHATGMAGACQSGRSPFEFTDSVVLALLLSAARQCAMGTFARGQEVSFPRERFLELAAQCVDSAEVSLAFVQKTSERIFGTSSKKEH